MKKLLSVCLIASMSLMVATAATPKTTQATTQATAQTTQKVTQTQQEPQKVVQTVSNKTAYTVTQFYTNINCELCEKKIMNKIPSKRGVEDVNVDLKSKVVTVVYNSKKTSTDTLVKAFDKIDINAKVIKSETIYK